MFENFSRYLCDKADFTTAELNQIEAVSHTLKIQKDELFVQEGTVWPYNGFVCSGLVRSFTIDDYGNECTLHFAPANYWMGDRASLLTGNAMPFSADAIEESCLLLIEQKDFHELCKKIETFNILMNTILQKNIETSQKLINENISMNEKEKYVRFLNKYSTVAHRIPHDMVASYVGATPDVLSRIIKSIETNQG